MTLALDAVTVTYGSTPALSAASVSFPGGTSTALVGANGSGKTTVLRLLSGLITPSQGRVIGRTSSTAFVRQSPRQHSWIPLRVSDVLVMGRYRDRGLLGRITGVDRALVGEAAQRMDVAGLVNRQLDELSGGQRQRVLVAQALIQEADVLLLDEPVTGLDLPSRDLILQVIAEEAQAGRSVVFSTHDLSEAAQADQVVLLAGSVVAAGPPATILTPSMLSEVFGVLRVAPDQQSMIFDDHGHGHA